MHAPRINVIDESGADAVKRPERQHHSHNHETQDYARDSSPLFHDSSERFESMTKSAGLVPHKLRRKRSYSMEQKIGKIPVHVLKRLPKAELHCHLDGAVRLDTIIELALEQVQSARE
jgi:hypothetical protein